MTRHLGMLLLGCVRHQRMYAWRFASLPEVRIVAVADEPDIPSWMHEANQSFADHFGVPYLRDTKAALGRRDVDFVSICSEPTRHARLALQAARSGKHIWVDKPMATSIADADELIDAVMQAGVKLSYVHRLYSPMIQNARDRIDRGEIGLPHALHVSFVSTGSVSSGAVEDIQLVVDRRLSGGGELMNFLGYPIDTVRFLTGLEVVRVYVSAGSYFFHSHREQGVEDFGMVFLTLEKGIVATIAVGRSPAPKHPTGGNYNLRIHGSAGTLIAEEHRPVLNVYSEPSVFSSQTAGPLADEMMTPLVEEFLAFIREERTPIRGVEDGRAVIAVIEAAYRSIASGQVEMVSKSTVPQ